jgi:L-alanine-DL-glutamate epimerase-like enolase superfamily enzyme
MELTIKDVKIHVLCMDIPETWKHLFGEGAKRYMGVLRVISDEGLEGHAFVGSSVTATRRRVLPIVENIKPFLVGQNALDRERHWHEMRRLAPRWDILDASIMGVDVALWDLCAKAAGIPLYQLLGAYNNKSPVYGSGRFHATGEATGEEALECKEQSLHGYKVHHGVPDIREIVDVCTKTRKSVGEDMNLMFDAERLLSFRDALYLGRALDEMNFFWYEDPMEPRALDLLTELSRKLDVPIALTDDEHFRFSEASILVNKKAARILISEVSKDGITGLRKLAHLAEAHHMHVQFHSGGNPLLNTAQLHVAMTIKNTHYFPWVLPAQTHHLGVIGYPQPDSDGYMRCPEGPGIGVDIDWSMVDSLTEAVF